MEAKLKYEFKRRIEDESLMRIDTCLDLLSDETIWYKPNQHVNSIGNLVLHLSGNIDQYINSTLGKNPDKRERPLEFSSVKTHSKEELRTLITDTIKEAVHVVSTLSKEDILKDYEVQCFTESGLSILVHVIEHTSYHTGQITQMCKWIKDVDTNYYGDLELEKTN